MKTFSFYPRFSTAIQRIHYPGHPNDGKFFIVGSLPNSPHTAQDGKSRIFDTEEGACDAIKAAGVTRFQLSNCAWRQSCGKPTGVCPRFWLIRKGPEGESSVFSRLALGKDGRFEPVWADVALVELTPQNAVNTSQANEIIEYTGAKANEFTLLEADL